MLSGKKFDRDESEGGISIIEGLFVAIAFCGLYAIIVYVVGPLLGFIDAVWDFIVDDMDDMPERYAGPVFMGFPVFISLFSGVLGAVCLIIHDELCNRDSIAATIIGWLCIILTLGTLLWIIDPWLDIDRGDLMNIVFFGVWFYFCGYCDGRESENKRIKQQLDEILRRNA